MAPLTNRYLKPGDTIGVAAPSARFNSRELEKGARVLESMGFRVKVSSDIHGTYRYLAGDDGTRARVLASLFEDPGVQAVISARGGYGAMRLLPLLDRQVFDSHPTWFIGFSDATALLTSLMSDSKTPVVHGPNLVSLARAGSKTLAGFKAAITGPMRPLSMSGGACLVSGTAAGRLVGGNLATLAHMAGTPFQPDFKGGILFLEDVGEPAYKIDRMLTQLQLAGVFHGIRGVVAGDFLDCANAEYLPEILAEVFAPAGIPVMTGLLAGHGPVNLAFPLGREVVLDTASATLSWPNG